MKTSIIIDDLFSKLHNRLEKMYLQRLALNQRRGANFLHPSLQKLGYIVRIKSKEESRLTLIYLTEEGNQQG